MFKTDSMISGLATGLLIPLLSFGLLLLLFEGVESLAAGSGVPMVTDSRVRTLMLVSICLNVLPLRYFQRKRFFQSLRGLVIPTFLLAMVWLVIFAKEVI